MTQRPDDEKPVDVFADRYTLEASPFGAVFSFALQEGGIEKTRRVHDVATVRMTLEHLKTLAFLTWQQVVALEKTHGCRFDMPAGMLTDLKIDRARWRAFWYGELAPKTVVAEQGDGKVAEAIPTGG